MDSCRKQEESKLAKNDANLVGKFSQSAQSMLECGRGGGGKNTYQLTLGLPTTRAITMQSGVVSARIKVAAHRKTNELENELRLA